MREYDWYDKEVEDQHRQREYLGSLSPEERKERQKLIAQLKEPVKAQDKVYVATRWERKEEVREAYKLCQQLGMTVSHDWTIYHDQLTEDRTIRAEEDISGVMECSLFLTLSDGGGTGMYIELGAAIASNILLGHPAIYVIGEHNDRSIFFQHSCVQQVASIGDALDDWLQSSD